MGLAIIAVIRPSLATPRPSGAVGAMFGGVLLATALFGVPIEGASRWIRIRDVSLQASLIILPAMIERLRTSLRDLSVLSTGELTPRGAYTVLKRQ